MSRILATGITEFRISFRNRWVLIATGMMVLFALVLAVGIVVDVDSSLKNKTPPEEAFLKSIMLLFSNSLIKFEWIGSTA